MSSKADEILQMEMFAKPSLTAQVGLPPMTEQWARKSRAWGYWVHSKLGWRGGGWGGEDVKWRGRRGQWGCQGQGRVWWRRQGQEQGQEQGRERWRRSRGWVYRDVGAGVTRPRYREISRREPLVSPPPSLHTVSPALQLIVSLGFTWFSVKSILFLFCIFNHAFAVYGIACVARDCFTGKNLIVLNQEGSN